MKLRLITRNDKMAHVNHETAKKISKKGLIFASLSLDMHQVLQALQEADHFVQTMKLCALKAEPLDPQREGEEKMLMLVKSGKFKRTMMWHVKNELLCYKQRWYVPLGFLRWELLRQHYDDPWAGHFGPRRTLELLQRHYYWPWMSTEVQKYVNACHACELTKPKRHLPHGKLQSLSIPMGPRKDWTMDFITGLPLCMRRKSVYDLILVIVNRYTKYAKYIPVRKDWKITDLADVLVEDIFFTFGKPVLLTNNWGSLFTSNYWSHSCYHLSVQLNYSTAFHLQTNGQTKRQNQTLEQYLRNYVNYQQDDWVFWLKLAEFAYNNSVHSSTGIAPFVAM